MHHSSKLLQENIKHCQFLAIKGTRKASPKIIILAWRKFGRFITSSKHSREPLCEVVTARINCVSCLESITTMQYYSEINQDKIVIKTSFSRLTEGTNWFSIVVYRCWLRFIIKNKLPNSVPVEKFSWTELALSLIITNNIHTHIHPTPGKQDAAWTWPYMVGG